ncbi:MAG: class I SAM-dependent methyltransferase [Burkholderiaceae bacterium]
MHPSAMQNGSRFFDTYVRDMAGPFVVDIGSQDVCGSLKSVLPSNARYLGVDMVAGKGVDLVIEDPYSLPLADASVDAVVSSSCFEHSELFWVAFLEMMRVLKPHGLLYLNAPSNGPVHRYPVDCWRFYPDSGLALQRWANRNGFDALLLESYISDQSDGYWNDFVCVMLRDAKHAPAYPRRIVQAATDFSNARCHPDPDRIINPQEMPEDLRLAMREREREAARADRSLRSVLRRFERHVRRTLRGA